MPASSFSSLNEVVSGACVSPSPHEVHQELLKRVALNLELEEEVVKEYTYSLVDTLTAAGPSKVALPLSEAVIRPVKAL